MPAENSPVRFTKGSARRIARAVKHFEGRGRGEAPPPRRRRVVSGGGARRRHGRVIAEIPAATPAQPLATGGRVRLQDESTGQVTSTEVDVTNIWRGVKFVVDAQVELDMTKSPPRVCGGTCDKVSW